MTHASLRIGETAQRAGVSVGTIRYYEKRRLLPPSPRSEGGYRLFTIETVDRVRFIRKAQEMGLSLDEITTLLGGGECGQVRDLLQSKLQEITERMNSLRGFARTLRRHLKTCEDELARHGAAAKCPVIFEIRDAREEVKR